MNERRWGPDGPPLEAYSRVTDPQRFEPLHRAALAHLERLQERFDVERAEGYGIDADMERQVQLARPTVKLVPADSKAAPIVVAFTTFPGLLVRCGVLLVQGFPGCGCDACDETAEGERQNLTETMEDVVAGRFHESIRLPLFGRAMQQWEINSSSHRRGGGVYIPRPRARSLVKKFGRQLDWSPWPLR